MLSLPSDQTTPHPQIAPYGAWRSPVTTDLIVSDFIRLTMTAVEGEESYWIEGRPSEGGRYVIMHRAPDGTIATLTPDGFNVRTRVHEYGGGDFAVHNGILYFANYSDQRLYRQVPGEEPVAITPETPALLRYASLVFDPLRNRLLCVCEDHRDSEREAINTLVSIALDGQGDDVITTLQAGNDFYSSPALSPDGQHLAWLTWNHPNMPWDGCELWSADFDAQGALQDCQQIAGGPQESIFQPQWSPDGVLYFVSDRTGWWNLYRYRDGNVEPFVQMEAEFGFPQWLFHMSSYAFVSAERIICRYSDAQGTHLADVETDTGSLTSIQLPYTAITEVRANAQQILLMAASSTVVKELVRIDTATHHFEVLRRSFPLTFDRAYISEAQPIEFPTERGLTAYAYYYAPQNPEFAAPEGELPPLLVISHGGPTGASPTSLVLDVQYWTSRGFGVLDVNYGGSSGYGRAYRERLKGQWGIVDVDDCTNGALYLVNQGLVDSKRMAIRGASAGGYTTLCALTFRTIFRAGASHFGVSDLNLLKDTHKFESRYLDGLVGPFPEYKEIYYQRSAINFTDQLSCPVIFFQGLEDEVVPPNQAETMVAALRAKKLPVAYLAFEGEQHGFRQGKNIKRSMEAELYFYSRVFHFTPADEIEPVEIENL
ncbi:S9 family peptidase [Tengunoibacter tsumagoiensis]|uniref:Peptidase n=1 Tax=Tengunoibacter tsumagoiensis TaxID=2014871 RepID=A0A401ZUQ5_9CHLR|nr:prolyl oligopeptidase family serine peptidase [Tengunoibacter tsumagoiensis]GCE10613.1 peptidase [Tengunoibacter tsumagoiensis]